MSERILCSVQVVKSVTPIPTADTLSVARVLDWEVVVKNGEVVPGSKVIYCEGLICL